MSRNQSLNSANISKARAAVKQGNVQLLSSVLKGLILQQPNGWSSIVTIHLFPDPTSLKSSVENDFGVWLEVFEVLIGEEGVGPDAILVLAKLISAFNYIHSRMTEIEDHLKNLSFFQNNKATKTFLLGVFLETQGQYIQKEMIEAADANGIYDPITALQSVLPDVTGEQSFSGVDAYEGLCEIVELNLRYTLHTDNSTQYGMIDVSKSPYGDQDFANVINLGGLWLRLKYLWEQIKYAGWLPKEVHGVIIYEPNDAAEFIRKNASQIREQLFLQELAMPYLPFGTDDADRVGKVAQSITIPHANMVWDGVLDMDALKEATKRTTYRSVNEALIRERHYDAFLSKVKVGKGGSDVDMATWLLATDVLRVFAEAVGKALRSSEEGVVNPVLVASTSSISDLMHKVTGMSTHLCKKAVSTLIFDEKLKSVDSWDQPLLPFGNDKCLLVPALVSGGLSLTAIQNFISQWGGVKFAVRSREFEDHIAGVFRAGTKSGIKQGLKFVGSDGREVEFDIIIFWDDYVLLVEAKCLKEVHSAADEWKAGMEVDYSLEQLARRKSLLLSDWEVISSLAPELSLPPSAPPPDKVLCISVINIMHFTSIQKDNSIVTDELCLKRFFTDPDIALNVMNRSSITSLSGVMRLRKNSAINPRELMSYLADPHQLRWIEHSLEVQRQQLMPTKDDEQPVMYPVRRFTGSATSLINYTKTDQGEEDASLKTFD